jgi:hypothetical protein
MARASVFLNVIHLTPILWLAFFSRGVGAF